MKEKGFTLIEIAISLTIISVLTAVAVPAYRVYMQKSELLLAEVVLRDGLRHYGALEGFHPASANLGDLVLSGVLREIPNDPWTAKQASATTIGEVGDWFYSNDGKNLILRPQSGKGNELRMQSLGLPPGSPPVAPVVSAAAARVLAKASRWEALAAKMQGKIDSIRGRLPAWQTALTATIAYAARHPAWKKNVRRWQRFIAGKQRYLARAEKKVAKWQRKAAKFRARAAAL